MIPTANPTFVAPFTRAASILVCLLAASLAFGSAQSSDRDRAIRQVDETAESGDLAGAARLARSWLEAQPGDPAMLQTLGRVESFAADKARRSNPRAANLAYQRSADAFQEAQRGVGPGKLSKQSYHTWAYCLFRVQKHAEAITQLQYAFDGSPRDAMRHALRARCHNAIRQGKQAIADFTAALKFTPQDVGLLIERAEVRRRLGKGALAAAELTVAVDTLPSPHGAAHTRLLRWVFEYFLGQNDVDAAIAPLERIRKAQPNLGWLRLELGILYYRKGAFDRAVAEFEPLLDGTLSVKSYGLGRVYARLGLIARHKGEPSKAEKHFRRALELSPNEATALRGLVSSLNRNGKREEALALIPALRTAVRLEEEIRRLSRQIGRDPRNKGARAKKILSLCELHRWDEASDEVELYGQVIPDGSVVQLRSDLARRKKEAGKTP